MAVLLLHPNTRRHRSVDDLYSDAGLQDSSRPTNFVSGFIYLPILSLKRTSRFNAARLSRATWEAVTVNIVEAAVDVEAIAMATDDVMLAKRGKVVLQVDSHLISVVVSDAVTVVVTLEY